jgi:hypothetical protein
LNFQSIQKKTTKEHSSQGCCQIIKRIDKGPKERRNGNTTEQKIKDQKKEETAIQLNRR